MTIGRYRIYVERSVFRGAIAGIDITEVGASSKAH